MFKSSRRASHRWGLDSRVVAAVLETLEKRQLLSAKNPVYTPDDNCPEVLAEEDVNAQGGNPGANSDTANPVRYSDGAVRITAPDLTSQAMGVPWGHTRSWTSDCGS